MKKINFVSRRLEGFLHFEIISFQSIYVKTISPQLLGHPANRFRSMLILALSQFSTCYTSGRLVSRCLAVF